MSETRSNGKSFSMLDKFKFHAGRTKGKFPVGYKFSPKEKAAYSAGWVQRAKTESRIYDYKNGIKRDKDGKRV